MAADGASEAAAPVAAGGPWPPVLATRNARLLLATRLTGQAGDGLLQAALGSFVLFSPERQTSAPQVAATFAVLLLPYSLVGPFAGVLLDRWSRARVLVAANIARALVVLAVVPIVAAGHDGLDLGLVVLLALGLGRLVLAGLSAGLPRTVHPTHLVTANALFPTAGTITSGISTVLGIALMTGLGPAAPQQLIVMVAVALVAAAFIAMRIPRNDLGPEPGTRPTASLGQDLLDVVRGLFQGLGHLRRRRRASGVLALVSATRLAFGAALVDTLLIVRHTLNSPAQTDAALADFAMTAAGASLGSLLAAVLAPRATRRLGGVRWAGFTILVAGLVTPLGLASRDLGWMVLGSLALGLGGQSMKIACDTTLQVEIADEFRGRVFALLDVVLNVSLVVGMTIVAFTVPATGISRPLWIALACLLVATGLSSLRWRHTRG